MEHVLKSFMTIFSSRICAVGYFYTANLMFFLSIPFFIWTFHLRNGSNELSDHRGGSNWISCTVGIVQYWRKGFLGPQALA
jgi:hypothetical protein